MNKIFTSMPPVAWHALFSFLALWVGQYFGSYEWGAGAAVFLNLVVRGIGLYLEKEPIIPAAAPSGFNTTPTPVAPPSPPGR